MADVTVTIVGDSESLKRALGTAQSSLDAFQAKARSVGDSATSIGRSMTFGLTLPITAAFKGAFDELSQSAAASAQTEAAIRSTGGAANVTAAQIDQLSSSLLRKTGIDDEVIKGGANVLLTFKAIKNEAGAGNDIFNQATKAALDLSVAFGKDMTSSAILVGKALQDPIQGVSALRRVGVQLTDSQVELIKSLVESGDQLGAQKVILRELTSEVGGSADAYGKTFAGQISRAKEEMKNAMAAILSTAIPVMQQVAEIALSAAQAFEGLPGPVKEGAVVLAALVAAAGPAAYIFGAISKAVAGAIAVFQTLASASETLAVKLLYIQDSFAAIGLGSVAAIAALAAVVAAFVAAAAAIGYPLHLLLGGDGFQGLFDAIEKAKKAGANWGDAIVAGAKAAADPIDELRKRLDTLRASQDAEINKLRETGGSLEQASATHVKYKGAIDAVKGAIGDYKQQQAEAKAADEARKQDLTDVVNGTTDLANASNAAKDAISNLQNAVLAASGGELGLQQANLNLTKAQQDYTDALNSGDPSKITEAELNLQQARLGVASATLNAQDANQKLLDIVHQGPEAVQAEIDKLKSAQTQYGDTSGAIQDQIDKLFWLNLSINGLPTSKSIPFDAPGLGDALGDVGNLHNALNNLPPSVTVRVIAEKVGDAWQALSGF